MGGRPGTYALLGGALGDVRDQVLELAKGSLRLARAAGRYDHRDLNVDDVVAHGERLLLLMGVLRGLLLRGCKAGAVVDREVLGRLSATWSCLLLLFHPF